MATATFEAREDSGSANNPSINLTSSVYSITFSTDLNDDGNETNDGGDLLLDKNGGAIDDDTVVYINGEPYSFSVDLTGTLPTTKNNGAQQVPDDLEGKQVTVIIVHGFDSNGDGIADGDLRLMFLNDGSGTGRMASFGNGAIDIQNVNTNPPPIPICFLRGTLIATPKGEVPVETLKAGDEVLTASGATATVRFAAARELTLMDLLLNPDMRPVCIPQGAMGEGLPRADLWVSPQHRVLVRGWEPEMLFGQDEVLVAAKHLKFAPTLRRPARPETVEYFHLMLDRHDIVLSNGIETESLFPGDTAIASLTEDARAEMARVFPEYAGDWTLYGPTARRTLSAREAEALWTKMAPLGAGEVKAVA